MSLSGWMFVLAGICVVIALLAIAWAALTRVPVADHEAIGDAALLDHPGLPRPPAKPSRREPEAMGA